MSKHYSIGCLSFRYNESRDVVYRNLEFLGFPYYRVGDDGSVWSRRVYGSRLRKIGPWWQLSPVKRVGMRFVSLYYDVGKYENWGVHQLVLTAFVGYCPEGMEGCHHPDHSPENNELINLRWDTHDGNMKDRIRQNRSNSGEKCYRSKLTDAIVRQIRAERKEGARICELAKRYKLTDNHICQIVYFEIWKHIT